MSRCLSREASAAEEEMLKNVLKKNEPLQQQYEILFRLWNKNDADDFIKNLSDENTRNASRIFELAKKQVNSNVENKKGRYKIIYSRILIAAAVLLIAFTGVWVLEWDKDKKAVPQKDANNIVATPNGNRTKITLPDGTSVWLNSGSKLSYSNNFSGPLREVRLEGEAYFDVVKNPSKPFIVHTGGVNIKVLGTAFDVKSYPADKTVETTLLRGLVQVTREYDAKQQPVFLHPNQKIILEKITAADNENKLPYVKKANEKEHAATTYHITALDSAAGEEEHIETAWLYNRLAFRGDNFEELAEKLERWYNIKIIFQDEKVKRLSFNGSFENETVEQAFTALKAASAFNFKMQGDEIMISSN